MSVVSEVIHARGPARPMDMLRWAEAPAGRRSYIYREKTRMTRGTYRALGH